MSSNMFGKKGRDLDGMDTSGAVCRSSSDKNYSKPRARLKSASLNCVGSPPRLHSNVCQYRMFVATWNVGGKTPNKLLNLEDFLQVEESPDIYVLGFQEIVPLTAGNVLVLEDNEPAARWLALIHQALNMPKEQDDGDDPSPSTPPPTSSSSAAAAASESSNGARHRRRDAVSRSSSGNLFFQTPSLKVLSNSYRVDSALVKTCNCSPEHSSMRRRAAEMRESVYRADAAPDAASTSAGGDATTSGVVVDDGIAASSTEPQCEPGDGGGGGMSYCLIASKQMVGLFLSVWVKKELVEHIGHLRVDCVGRGIMGWLGNKGCIAMSMTLHHTSFCFVCSHLASGEKEGDELRRNADVAEIVKSAHFPRACRPSPAAGRRVPERILDHDRMIWFGDLNYRIALSYDETRTLLEENDWDALLEKDQLMIEREAGRVFRGWKEGKICFAPTYKYTHNSDAYAGETAKSKKKRRTPAWCDRILWQGDGIEQLQYLRGESRFSDHRPVCGVFAVEVATDDDDSGGGGKIRKGYFSLNARIGGDVKAALPQCHHGDVS
ncbi:type I inositol polyphosphate 5-phosphatase 5-like isoform X2 [Oryza brachyantha]|uniref:Inositol polyphosphate-related phosphatase domain-containing protein n=1 Tax=Oryza brachyantha TaxID=4533 RepID=J3MCJ7_ORYBR|nr:type I inositol polyphosphate 5-phosphatase 5-like isoform X2 [Oryza brachyantha]